MREPTICVGITGGSGYIGRALLAHLPLMGWSGVSLGRREISPKYAHRHADINEPMPLDLIDGLDAVIHMAADTGAGDSVIEQEVAFAAALAAKAREYGIPMLFMSSQAASAISPSKYGRTKAAIEAAILPLGALVIRPGLVYGGEEKGLFGLLSLALRRFRICPWLLPSPWVQPIHVDDLVRAIFAAVRDASHRGRVFNVGSRPISFNVFLTMLARFRVRGSIVRVPVPVALLRLLLVLGGRVLGPRLDPTRLDSLTGLVEMDTTGDMALLGIAPRDVRDGLSFSGRPHRRLLIEARALARAITARRMVPAGLLRRYMRALLAQGQQYALDLPLVLLQHPRLLASLDRVSQRHSDRGTLMGRMDMMCRLCESESQLASLFMNNEGRRARARVAGDFASSALKEVQARVLSPFARLLAGVRRHD